MSDKYPPPVQRKALVAFRDALDCQYRALCRDECGDWRIEGKYGHVSAVPGIPWGGMEKTEGFQLYVVATPRMWGFVKKDLHFCRLTQDGDEEGMFFFDRLPTVKQANAIRSRLGLKKRKALSEEGLARLRQTSFRSREGFQPRKTASEEI